MSLKDKYGFDPVLEPTKRKEKLKELEHVVGLMSEIKENLVGRELLQLKEALFQLAQLQRIDRSENDVLFFAYQYFGLELNPDCPDPLIPTGVTIDNAPDFHVELTDMLNVVSNEEVNKRIAWGAPRGSAKSAYLSNVFPIHQTVFQKRKYILIISETEAISQRFMEFVSNQLKFNELLREDFGEILSPAKQSNEKDNLSGFKTKTGTLVEASSIGSQLRGRRNGAYRPDLVIADDMESSKNTNTAELRDKNLHWWNSVVMPIGDLRTAFIYLGTAVHHEGLLFSVMSRPDFESRLFSSIISPPERQDLWDELEKILRDKGEKTAREFYEKNREEMDLGVQVLWEQQNSYFKLMVHKASMPSRAFSSEYLNIPYALGEQLYNPTEFTYITPHELEQMKHRLTLFGAWDLAFTAGKRSDFNSVTILGKDRVDGKIYVVHNWSEKLEPHKALLKVYEIIMFYQPTVFSMEVTGGATDLYYQMNKKLSETFNNRTRLKQLKTTRASGSKVERLESMQPLVVNGTIIFQKQQTRLLEEFELFPWSPHDDNMDSLYQALQLVGVGHRRKSWKTKPNGL